MPEKDGDEGKSTKSVVNKKQKQMMNTEEFSDRQRSDMKNLLTKNFGDESTAKNTAIKVKASRAKEITGQSAVRDSQKYASGEYAKLGGGERMSLKMKGRGAATAGANPTKTGGPKENPKSLGGKSKGNTPVKVDVKKKIDMGKYFGGLGEKIDPLNFGKSKRTPEQKQQARSQKQRTDAVFNTKKGLGDMKTGTQSSEFLKTQKDVKKKPEDSQPLDEEGYDIARDMGKVRPSKDKKDATTMPVSKEMRKTQKVNKGPSALDIVKKKYKGQIMKVEELDLTKVAEAFGGYIVEKKIIKKSYSNNNNNNNNKDDEDGNVKTEQEKGRKKIEKKYQKPPNQELPPPRRGFEDVTGEGKVKFPKTREELEAKRKEYEIDAKGNITDRGVEKYARQIYRTNLPLTQAQLNRARQFAVGGKEVKDSEGNVIGKTTGKYGGKLSPKASEKELEQTRQDLRTKGFKVPGEIKPQKDRVTTGSAPDYVPPKKETGTQTSLLSRIRKAGVGVAKNVAKSPVAPLIGYDLGKGIVSKIDQVMFPPVRGGRAGTRTAGSFTAS